MANTKQRYEKMLFNDTTTNRTDYRIHKFEPYVLTEHKEKAKYLRIRPAPLKDMHTLFDWKTCGVPFNLLHKPRPHIDTVPTKAQPAYFKLPDEDKDNAQKTRPRVVMTPAVSLDDVQDPEARKLLVNEIYTSEMTRSMNKSLKPYLRIVAPIPDLPAKSNPISIPKLAPPYVSPEWRMETLAWDRKQLRGHCDTTKRFWLSRELPPCGVCETSNAANQHSINMCQLKQESRLKSRQQQFSSK